MSDDYLKELATSLGSAVSKAYIEALLNQYPEYTYPITFAVGLFGAAMNLRRDKVTELLDLMRERPEVFSGTLLTDPVFVDGMMFLWEKYIRERNLQKRVIIKRILIDFAQTTDKSTYTLERYYHVLSLLTEQDASILREVINRHFSPIGRFSDSPKMLTPIGLTDTRAREEEYRQVFGNIHMHIENIQNLLQLGLIIADPTPRHGPVNAPFVKVTEFGNCFVNFLKM